MDRVCRCECHIYNLDVLHIQPCCRYVGVKYLDEDSQPVRGIRVLFVDCENGHSYKDPRGILVWIYQRDRDIRWGTWRKLRRKLRKLEGKQPYLNRVGGSAQRLMKDSGLLHEVLSVKRMSEYSKKDYDFKYNLVVGNY